MEDIFNFKNLTEEDIKSNNEEMKDSSSSDKLLENEIIKKEIFNYIKKHYIDSNDDDKKI